MSSLSEIDYLTSLVVDNWERAFNIEKVNDREIKIHLEFEEDLDRDNIWEFLPMRLDKYTVMVYKVPIGYIDVFIRAKNKM
jgi:hypothetical protein